jgi:type IV secretion system protein VirB9
MTDYNWQGECLKLVMTAALTISVTSQLAPARSAELPKPGKEDQRVTFIDYNPYNVTRIVGGIRASTQIEFAGDEDIIHVAIGNTIAWEVAPAGHVLFLKPREHHPSTNMQVITARKDGVRRSYQIEIATLPETAASRTPPMLFVKYRYPTDEALKARIDAAAKAEDYKAGQADRILAKHQEQGPRNWAYSIQGEASYEPVEVYDNGKVTTFVFEGQTEMPAIYLAQDDGHEELVPKNVYGRRIMVHALGKKFVLRRGTEVMCVFNEQFNPVGIDTWTMTTSPNVERVVKQPKRPPSQNVAAAHVAASIKPVSK